MARKTTKSKPRKDWLAQVQGQLEALIEDGKTMPWHKPWRGGHVPTSVATGKPYAGYTNLMILNATSWTKGYSSNLWLTGNKAKQLGGHIRKGEKGTGIMWVSPQSREVKNKDTGEKEVKSWFSFGGCYVWNLDQCDGVELPENLQHFLIDDNGSDEIAYASMFDLWSALPERPRLQYAAGMAAYNVTHDYVTLPPVRDFDNEIEYWSAAWHEIGHWRRRQAGQVKEGKGSYAFEELVVETFSCQMLLHAGIDPTDASLKNSGA